jgi:hypothetical protein
MAEPASRERLAALGATPIHDPAPELIQKKMMMSAH